MSTSAKVVQGGTGGARVFETRSKRARWRTLGARNARSVDTGSGRCSRAESQLSGFQLLRGVTGAPPDGFLIDGHLYTRYQPDLDWQGRTA